MKEEVVSLILFPFNDSTAVDTNLATFNSLNAVDTCYHHYVSTCWIQSPKAKQELRIGFEGVQTNQIGNQWALIPSLLLLIILARIKPFKDKTIGQYFNASVSSRFVDQLIREESGFFNPISTLLIVFNFMTASIGIVAAQFYFDIMLFNGTPQTVFYKALILVSCYFFAKFTLIEFFGFLINQEKKIQLYQFNLLLFTKISGLIVLIPVLFAVFSEGTFQLIGVYGFLALWVLSFFLRLVKSVLIGWTKEAISFYYIILYICAFEITPLLIIGKTLFK